MEQLSNVLTQIAEEPIEDLFWRRIGAPIGMDPNEWDWIDWENDLPQGPNPPGSIAAVNTGSAGLDISAQNAARFGHLFLNRGQWDGEQLIGCGALKELDSRHGEIKSMRTASSHRRKGAAKQMVQHILAEARRRGYRRLSLETGATEAFEPARRLYEKFGFDYCGPFGDYGADSNSAFMTKQI